MTVAGDLLKASGLDGLAAVLLGWDARTQTVPALPAAIFIFVFAFVIGHILSNIAKEVLVQPIREYALEFIKTMTLCTYPFGLGMARAFYGETGFILITIAVLVITLYTLPDGDGNPLATWTKYFAGIIPLRKCVINNILQIAASLVAFRIGMYIMSLELHAAYTARLRAQEYRVCGSALQASVSVGAAAEMVGGAYVMWFFGQKLVSQPLLDLTIKITNLVLVLSAGSGLTGMFLNPTNASCHTYGCGNTSKPAHILVYWAGPLLGAWLGVQMVKSFSISSANKADPAPAKAVPKTDAKRKKRE